MNVGSLFSGIGGMDAGLARAGLRHAFFCESDPWRREVLAARWPGVTVYDDVRNVGVREPLQVGRGGDEHIAREGRPRGLRSVPGGNASDQGGTDASDRVDLLCGGFPCQDLSVAGKRAGLAGDRSGLFFEFARIIDAFRPRWVLLENVPGLLSSQGGRDFGVVLGTLADLGYGLGWRVLDSRFFGVPQRRRRVFIVGARADGDPSAAAGRAGQVLAVGSRCPGHPPTGTEAGTNVAAPLRASAGRSGGNSYDADAGFVASLSGLGSGGPDDNDGQAGRLVAPALTKNYGKQPDNSDTNLGPMLVAAPLTKGSASGEGVNAPGRRQEDDVNIVAYPISGDALRAGDAMTPSADAEGRVRLRDPGLGIGDEGAPAFTPTKAHPGAVAFHQTQEPIHGEEFTPAIGRTSIGMGVSNASGVRRLTPIECERLQGLPDGWTQLDAKTPDSRRYSALGDAVTANVAEWIGYRLARAERESVAA